MVRFKYKEMFAVMEPSLGGADVEFYLTIGGDPKKVIPVEDGDHALQVLRQVWTIRESESSEVIRHNFDRFTFARVVNDLVLTFEDEVNLAMFYHGSTFLNSSDRELYDLRLVPNTEKVVVHGSVPPLLPHLKLLNTRAWWPAMEKDMYYRGMLLKIREKFPNVRILDAVNHKRQRMAQLDLKTYSQSVRVIQTDVEPSGRVRIAKLHPHRAMVEIPDDKKELKRAQSEIQRIVNGVLQKEWDGFFPTDTDVVEMEASKFFDLTLAGACPEPYNFAVGWRSHHKVILMRFHSGDVRCPKQFRGQLLGRSGVNLNQIAKRKGIGRINLI